MPGSGSATSLGLAGGSPYGNGVSRTVRSVSASTRERKSVQTSRPSVAPNSSTASSSTRAEGTSLPPPLPNWPATIDAMAMMSAGSKASGGSPIWQRVLGRDYG